MIDRLVEFAMGHRVLVVVLALAVGIWGFASFEQLPIEAYPDVMDTQIMMISQWPGHAAEEMEQQVSIPLETVLTGIPGLSVMRSRSLFGLSVVYLSFDTGVTDDYARNQTVQRLQGVNLPAGVSPQMSPQASATGEIYRYTLAGPGYSLTQLKEIEDWTLEREFKSIPGVADVNSFGGFTKRYELLIDPDRLRAYGITLSQVEQALAANNANAGGNYIERGSQEYVIRGIGLFASVDDIARTVIAVKNGVPVLARDLGEVHIGHKTRLGKVGKDEQDDVVEGIVLLLRGANADVVLDGIHAKVKELNTGGALPPGVRIVTYVDRTDLVQTTTHTVLHNLFMGVSLVIFILFIFLGNVRATLIVAIVIPLSLLFAFGAMHLQGISANLLSIGAVDFGIIVDSALIMVENIYRRLGEPRGPDESVLSVVTSAAADVQRPIFYSVSIIVLAYLPIFTMESVERKMFSPMAVTISCALAGALLLSLTLAPVLCSYLLKGNISHDDTLPTRIARRAYTPALNWALASPWMTVLIAVACLGGGMLLATRLGSEFLPHLDEGNLWVRATMPSTISYSAATRLVTQMRSVMRQFPEVTFVVSQNGRPDDGTDAVGFDDAEFMVGLKPREEWPGNITKDELIHQMNDAVSRFPGIEWNFSQLIEDNVEEAMTGVKGELAVKVFGDDLVTLTDRANAIKDAMGTVHGITDLGIFDELGEPQVTIIPDRDACARLGVNVADVQDIVQTAIGGNPVTTFLDGMKQFDVVVRFKKEARDSLESIQQILVSTPDGSRVPLSALAKVQYSSGAAFIYRESGKRFIAIKFSVRDRDLGTAIADAQQVVQTKVKLPTGYTLQWGGEFQSMQRAQRRLMMVIPLSILLILTLLYWTFSSLKHAVLILLNVPFSVIGGVLALYLTGVNLSVSAAVGFISVFGVAVLNGVILISCLNQLRAEGHSLKEAIRVGCMLRMRPVLMSALLAMLGMIPAATSTGIGSDVQKPLAIVIIGGLVTATLLTLLVLPVLYALTERDNPAMTADY